VWCLVNSHNNLPNSPPGSSSPSRNAR